MMARMAMQFEGALKRPSGYTLGDDYEHEHRDAEYEHEISR
jgi:hypothetical protein